MRGGQGPQGRDNERCEELHGDTGLVAAVCQMLVSLQASKFEQIAPGLNSQIYRLYSNIAKLKTKVTKLFKHLSE